MDRDSDTKPAFGAWLLRHNDRSGIVGELAAAAARDPRFPKQGDSKGVHARLRELQADRDTRAALEDAEDDWRNL